LLEWTDTPSTETKIANNDHQRTNEKVVTALATSAMEKSTTSSNNKIILEWRKFKLTAQTRKINYQTTEQGRKQHHANDITSFSDPVPHFGMC